MPKLVAAIYICVLRDATLRSIYSLFTAKLLYMFQVPFTPITRSTGNCSRTPLVQVICRDRLEGAASNPLKTIHSLA
jgi:hypothetical protein